MLVVAVVVVAAAAATTTATVVVVVVATAAVVVFVVVLRSKTIVGTVDLVECWCWCYPLALMLLLLFCCQWYSIGVALVLNGMVCVLMSCCCCCCHGCCSFICLVLMSSLGNQYSDVTKTCARHDRWPGSRLDFVNFALCFWLGGGCDNMFAGFVISESEGRGRNKQLTTSMSVSILRHTVLCVWYLPLFALRGEEQVKMMWKDNPSAQTNQHYYTLDREEIHTPPPHKPSFTQCWALRPLWCITLLSGPMVRPCFPLFF